jgi:hypothetical protein
MALSFIRVSDFTVQNEGTIYSLYANTEAAREWVNEHLPEDRMTLAGNAQSSNIAISATSSRELKLMA